MLKQIWMFITAVILLTSGMAYAESAIDKAFKRELPGWTQYGKEVMGDLNGDTTPDFGVSLYKPEQQDLEPEKQESMIVVFFGDGKGGYTLQTKASKVNCIRCGGAKGNPDGPLGELQITPKGILELTYQGGSREMWTDTMKWRWDFRASQFLLIGQTYSVVDTLAEEKNVDTLDINYSSLKAERRINGKKKISCKVDPRFKGQSLSSFDYQKNNALEKIRGKCKSIAEAL